MANKGIVIVGAGIVVVVGALLLSKKAGAAPVEDGVVVGLLNPPFGATMWTLLLTDRDFTVLIDPTNEPLVPAHYIDIAEAAIFEIPSGVSFPLKIVTLQITKWNDDETALIQLYYVQSIRPYLWDWDINDWGDEPDPTYRAAFIPDYGTYNYNVATEQFR